MALQSRVEHSTTEPLRSNNKSCDRLAMALRDTIRVSYNLDPDQDPHGGGGGSSKNC